MTGGPQTVGHTGSQLVARDCLSWFSAWKDNDRGAALNPEPELLSRGTRLSSIQFERVGLVKMRVLITDCG